MGPNNMTMNGFTYPKTLSLGAGFENRRVCVGIRKKRVGFHLGVEEYSFMRHAITDKANDDCVPNHGCWTGNFVEQLAGKMGLAFPA